jgi:hypothetical protein
MLDILKDIYQDKRYWEGGENDTGTLSGRKLRPFVMLGGSDFSEILPRHWEAVIRPNHSVTMRFYDSFLNYGLIPGERQFQKTEQENLQKTQKKRFWKNFLNRSF